MKFFPSVCLIALIICACSTEDQNGLPSHLSGIENLTIYPENAEPSHEFLFSPEVVFSDTTEAFIDMITSVKTDQSGRVYIADRNNAIHVFDEDGNKITVLGSEGRGPGEFLFIRSMDLYDETLYVLDARMFRIQKFSTEDFSLIGEITLNPEHMARVDHTGTANAEDMYVISDDEILLHFSHIKEKEGSVNSATWISVFKINAEGDIASDTLLEYEHLRHMRDRESLITFYDVYGGRGHVVVSAENRIYQAWSEYLLFQVYDLEGKPVSAFYHPFEHRALSREDALSYRDGNQEISGAFRRAMERFGVPERWRAFQYMVADDQNRIWVGVIGENPDDFEWWVMNEEGALHGRFILPGVDEIVHIRGNQLYVIRTDDGTGLQELVRYRSRFDPNVE